MKKLITNNGIVSSGAVLKKYTNEKKGHFLSKKGHFSIKKSNMKIDNLAGNHLKNPTRVQIKSIKNTEIYLPKIEKNRSI